MTFSNKTKTKQQQQTKTKSHTHVYIYGLVSTPHFSKQHTSFNIAFEEPRDKTCMIQNVL